MAKTIVVALDSMTLIWGIARKGKQEYLDRAKFLFRTLDHEKPQIIVPAVVATEYLGFVEPDKHADVLAALSQRFFIAPFDVRCARLAAVLWRTGLRSRPNKGNPNSRISFRADTLIVATAKTYGAAKFYSHDADCRKLAEKAGLVACDLPAHSEFLIAPDQWGADP